MGDVLILGNSTGLNVDDETNIYVNCENVCEGVNATLWSLSTFSYDIPRVLGLHAPQRQLKPKLVVWSMVGGRCCDCDGSPVISPVFMPVSASPWLLESGSVDT